VINQKAVNSRVAWCYQMVTQLSQTTTNVAAFGIWFIEVSYKIHIDLKLH